jgi:hypothetical protein
MSGTERESACLMGPEVVIKNLFDRPRAHLREGLQGQAGLDTGAAMGARHYVSADGTGVCALDAALRDLSQAAIAPDAGA